MDEGLCGKLLVYCKVLHNNLLMSLFPFLIRLQHKGHFLKQPVSLNLGFYESRRYEYISNIGLTSQCFIELENYPS